MIAQWILIFVVTTSANFGGGPATTVAYFKTKTACETVLKDMRTEAAKSQTTGLWGGCYPDQ